MSWICEKRLSMNGSKTDIDALVGDLPPVPNDWPQRVENAVMFWAHHLPIPEGLTGKKETTWKRDTWGGEDPDCAFELNRISETQAELVGYTGHTEEFPEQGLKLLSAKFPDVKFFWEWCSSDGEEMSGMAVIYQGKIRDAIKMDCEVSRLAWDRESLNALSQLTLDEPDASWRPSGGKLDALRAWDYTPAVTSD